MAYDINMALQRLEENLQSLDTARNQVKSTVEASEQLQQTISGYLSAINSFVEEIKTWERQSVEDQKKSVSEANKGISEVKNLCTQVASDFKEDTRASITKMNAEYSKGVQEIETRISNILTKAEEAQSKMGSTLQTSVATVAHTVAEIREANCDIIKLFKEDEQKVTKGFQASVSTAINELSQERSLLSNRVEELKNHREELQKTNNELSSLKLKLGEVATLLKDSQRAQDTVLGDIQSKLNSILGKVNDVNNAIATQLRENYDSIKSKLNELDTKLSQIQNALTTISDKGDRFALSCSGIKTSVEQLQSACEENIGDIKTNRIIMIIGFVIIAILQFILNH